MQIRPRIGTQADPPNGRKICAYCAAAMSRGRVTVGRRSRSYVGQICMPIHNRDVDRVSGRGGDRMGIQRYVNVDEYRQLLGVGRSTVFQWIKEGKLVEGVHYVRMGKRVLRFPHPQALEAPLAHAGATPWAETERQVRTGFKVQKRAFTHQPRLGHLRRPVSCRALVTVDSEVPVKGGSTGSTWSAGSSATWNGSSQRSSAVTIEVSSTVTSRTRSCGTWTCRSS